MNSRLNSTSSFTKFTEEANVLCTPHTPSTFSWRNSCPRSFHCLVFINLRCFAEGKTDLLRQNLTTQSQLLETVAHSSSSSRDGRECIPQFARPLHPSIPLSFLPSAPCSDFPFMMAHSLTALFFLLTETKIVYRKKSCHSEARLHNSDCLIR